MKISKLVFFTVFSLNYLYCIDFLQLQELLQENSKQLHIKKLDIDISKENLNILKSKDYPSISLGMNIEDATSLEQSLSSSSVGENTLINDSLKKSYSYLNLNYNIYSFGRFNDEKSIEKNKIEITTYSYCLEKKELILKLLEFYNQAINNQNKIETLQEILKLKDKIYKYKNSLYEIGEINKIEVSKNAIDIANLYSQITDNQKELENKLEEITLLTDYSFLENEKLIPLFFDDLKENMKFDSSVEAYLLSSQIKAKMSEIELYSKEYLPNLNFYFKYDLYGSDEDSYKKSLSEMKENSYKFGLNLTLNLFDGFKTTSTLNKTFLELKQLQKKYDYQKDLFEKEVNFITRSYKAKKENLEKNSEALNLSQNNQKNVTRLQKIGEVDEIEKLNFEIEEKYKYLDYKLNQGELAYEYTKNKIYQGANECIVR